MGNGTSNVFIEINRKCTKHKNADNYNASIVLCIFCLIGRRWRDSNPRAPEGYLISSQARYGHFDTSAFLL